MKKRILVLGGDGYLGWPTAMHFARRGNVVHIMDSLVKRHWEHRLGISPLFSVPILHERVRVWNEMYPEHQIGMTISDISTDPPLGLYQEFERFKPDVVVDYAEQPSAPFSMKDRNGAVTTVRNNVVGTVNVLWAMHKFSPGAHLIKLGTMGEYGTPGIPIEEGWIQIPTPDGKLARLPFPKLPGSFYHATKVADSVFIEMMCRTWGIRSTDLNQGVVYGIETEECALDPRFATSFHYDSVFGTVLNRFVVEAACGVPLTVFGHGGQKRGFLNIKDTIQCVDLAAYNTPTEGVYRVFNQFTEVWSVMDLAKLVIRVAENAGISARIKAVSNPRVEAEDHPYDAKNTSLLSLGLKPSFLTEEVVETMLSKALEAAADVDQGLIFPKIHWRGEEFQNVFYPEI